MDFDTTRTKDSYEQILQAFGNHEADILIGTQMIVKGHDFADVTLVGILAADMSLHVSDYHASERTFQLLTQAAGRAGRGSRPGQVVIQTYDPDHFAIQTARRQDYEAFYEQEKLYREMLHYPPVWNMLVILCSSPDEQALAAAAEALGRTLSGLTGQPKAIDAFGCTHAKGAAASEPGFCGGMGQDAPVQMIGPADAAVSKINDIYRKVIYLKTSDYDKLIAVKDEVERLAASDAAYKNITIQFDFNPMSGF
jgi:primosomal protein N' (replication factor Y)